MRIPAYVMCACMCMCVREHVHACVRTCVRACGPTCTIHIRFALNLHLCKRADERASFILSSVIRLIPRCRRTKLRLRSHRAAHRREQSQTLPFFRSARNEKVTVCVFSISFMAERNVNCSPLPLNCSLVVLITVLIDAEIELLPRAIEGENQR